MIDIILTLVFSIVMLLFMIFPAMKTVEIMEKRISISEKWHNLLIFALTLFFSLLIGVFLRFW